MESPMTDQTVKDVNYRPPGTQHNLLNEVSLSLPEKSLGLIYGRSGSGKTTHLQILAGLSKPTSGFICTQKYGNDGQPNQPPETLSSKKVGIVFQFSERNNYICLPYFPKQYFLTDTVLEDVIFGWPKHSGGLPLRQQLASRLQTAIHSVGLIGISMEKDPQFLSGGFKGHLALAVQLVRMPDLLLLDEPLAGLGNKWKTTTYQVNPLSKKKSISNETYNPTECTLRDRDWRSRTSLRWEWHEHVL
ncbi:hypothetical protein AMTRI_Chr07g78180 [Amborella trichopoda]